MREHVNFVLRKLDLIDMMAIKSETEMYGLRRAAAAYFNAALETEAQQTLKAIQREFTKTAETCFALAELYKFGTSEYLPGLNVSIDLHKAAYWTIEAYGCGNRQVFEFLNRFVPEFFIEGIRPQTMVDIVRRALEEQGRLVPIRTSLAERKKMEIIDNLVIDWLIYSDWQTQDKEALYNRAWKQYHDLCPDFRKKNNFQEKMNESIREFRGKMEKRDLLYLVKTTD